MEFRYRREVSVGAMLILGTAAFLFLLMWLRGKSLGHAVLIEVDFDDVAGLKEGDPVRTSGVRVGRIKTIELESPGHVRVYLDIRKGRTARRDAIARILSSDLFGARFVDYNPGSDSTPLPAGTILRGQRMQDMGEMAAQLSGKGNALLDSVNQMTAMVSRELRTTLRSTQTLLATLNNGAGTSTQQLVGTLEDLRHALQRVDQLVQQNGPAAGEAVTNLRNASLHADSLTRTLAHASAQFDSVLAKVNGGHGAVATLLTDSTVVRNLMSTNEALRALMVDFKANPGRYIHVHVF